MKRFADKVVLITGGNVGIGRATALAFAAEGAKVVITARRETESIAVVKEIQAAGGVASFIRADVAIEADVVAAVKGTVQLHGRLDVLFNNAGIEGTNSPIDALTAANFDQVFAVNVRGLLLAIREAVPHLKKTRGVIINNSSVVADIGFPNTAIYSASKGAVHALTRSAAIELIKDGVRVNAVSPGPIETDMGARFFGSIENMRGFAQSGLPLGAPGQPQDIAAAVLFLASSESRFVVGQLLALDGGLTAQ